MRIEYIINKLIRDISLAQIVLENSDLQKKNRNK